MTTIKGSLDTTLASLQRPLSTLYTQETGFLRYNSSNWTLSHIAIKNREKQEAYQSIAMELCVHGVPQAFALRDQTALILSINRFFTDTRKYLTKPNCDELGQIRFNSTKQGYEWLSNFMPSLVLGSKEEVFPSTESFYHTTLLQSFSLSPPNKMDPPLNQKKMAANTVCRWLESNPHHREAFDEKRLEVMLDATRKKYSQNPHLSQLLLNTEGIELVEESTTDFFFGSSFNEDREEKGLNHLGKILMQVRNELKKP